MPEYQSPHSEADRHESTAPLLSKATLEVTSNEKILATSRNLISRFAEVSSISKDKRDSIVPIAIELLKKKYNVTDSDLQDEESIAKYIQSLGPSDQQEALETLSTEIGKRSDAVLVSGFKFSSYFRSKRFPTGPLFDAFVAANDNQLHSSVEMRYYRTVELIVMDKSIWGKSLLAESTLLKLISLNTPRIMLDISPCRQHEKVFERWVAVLNLVVVARAQKEQETTRNASGIQDTRKKKHAVSKDFKEVIKLLKSGKSHAHRIREEILQKLGMYICSKTGLVLDLEAGHEKFLGPFPVFEDYEDTEVVGTETNERNKERQTSATSEISADINHAASDAQPAAQAEATHTSQVANRPAEDEIVDETEMVIIVAEVDTRNLTSVGTQSEIAKSTNIYDSTRFGSANSNGSTGFVVTLEDLNESGSANGGDEDGGCPKDVTPEAPEEFKTPHINIESSQAKRVADSIELLDAPSQKKHCSAQNHYGVRTECGCFSEHRAKGLINLAKMMARNKNSIADDRVTRLLLSIAEAQEHICEQHRRILCNALHFDSDISVAECFYALGTVMRGLQAGLTLHQAKDIEVIRKMHETLCHKKITEKNRTKVTRAMLDKARKVFHERFPNESQIGKIPLQGWTGENVNQYTCIRRSLEEIELHLFHCAPRLLGKDSLELKNMVHSITQQVIRQNPWIWFVNVMLRLDYSYALISLPKPMTSFIVPGKYDQKFDTLNQAKGFHFLSKHNIEDLIEFGVQEHQVPCAVILNDMSIQHNSLFSRENWKEILPKMRPDQGLNQIYNEYELRDHALCEEGRLTISLKAGDILFTDITYPLRFEEPGVYHLVQPELVALQEGSEKDLELPGETVESAFFAYTRKTSIAAISNEAHECMFPEITVSIDNPISKALVGDIPWQDAVVQNEAANLIRLFSNGANGAEKIAEYFQHFNQKVKIATQTAFDTQVTQEKSIFTSDESFYALKEAQKQTNMMKSKLTFPEPPSMNGMEASETLCPWENLDAGVEAIFQCLFQNETTTIGPIPSLRFSNEDARNLKICEDALAKIRNAENLEVLSAAA